MTTIHLVQTSAGAPEAYDALDENGKVVGWLSLRNGWFAVSATDAENEGHPVQVYGAAIDGDYSVFGADERPKFLAIATRKITDYLDDSGAEAHVPDVAAFTRAVAAALEQAAIADYDRGDGDGKVIEIYIDQIAPIVAMVLRED
jgi:hypothetical protein